MRLDVSPSSTPEPRGSSSRRVSSASGDLSPQFVNRNPRKSVEVGKTASHSPQMKMLNYASALALVLGTVAVASAQVATQTKAQLTPETKALHLRAKRPLSIVTAEAEVSRASDSGINSEQ